MAKLEGNWQKYCLITFSEMHFFFNKKRKKKKNQKQLLHHLSVNPLKFRKNSLEEQSCFQQMKIGATA